MATLTIASNLASTTVQRALRDSSENQSASYERLSSGLRINKAADDAAGLAVAQSLHSSKRVFAQGVRNLNDGISLANTAEGALGELRSMLTRMQELTQQAANGTYSYSQRKAMNSEAQALRLEFNRIIQTTKFNGQKLIDGTQSSLILDTGSGTGSTRQINIGFQSAAVAGDGTYGAAASFANGTGATGPTGLAMEDVTGDGLVDLVTSSLTDGKLNVSVGNGDGSFKAAVTYVAQVNAASLVLYDLNGDAKLDAVVTGGSTMLVLFGNGDGSFNAAITNAVPNTPVETAFGDFNGDGKVDAVVSSSFADSLSILIGNGNGTFKAGVSFAGGDNPWDVVVRDINGDGNLDLLSAVGNDDLLNVYFGNGNGTFKAAVSYYGGDGATGLKLADLNDDGVLDAIINDITSDTISVLIGNSGGSFSAARTYGVVDAAFHSVIYDVNYDSYEDIVAGAFSSTGAVHVFFGNGDGTFKADTSYAVGASVRQVALSDTNQDGVVDLISASSSTNSVQVLLGNTTAALTAFTLLSADEARFGMSVLQTASTRLDRVQGSIGASLSRLSVGVQNLSSMADAYYEAYSRIMDVDVASETAKLVSSTIRTQAATALLAQANQQPSLVLQLLK